MTPEAYEAQLQKLRNTDNTEELRDEFLQTALQHQHNLSVSGGSKSNTYILNLGYVGSRNYVKRGEDQHQVRVSLVDQFNFFRWLNGEVGFSGNFTNETSLRGFDPLYYYFNGPSYERLRDEKGDLIPWQREAGKSLSEVKRLTDLGLLDQTFYPTEELNKVKRTHAHQYYRIHSALTFSILDDLSIEGKFVTEPSYGSAVTTYDAYSHRVKNMVNNAAQVDPLTGHITYNIPRGGQIHDLKNNSMSYTLRAQANYNSSFSEMHKIVALAGAEQRRILGKYVSQYQLGFDPITLSHTPIDPLSLTFLNGTEAIHGTFQLGDYDILNNTYFTEDEDRFVSFYGNAAYTFNSRYSVTGSIRVDQSNLFGTAPELQWKPLWSVGVSWAAKEESFLQDVSWLNQLNLRLTYGVNGNVNRTYGAFLTLSNQGFNTTVQEMGYGLGSPANPLLRWEKTQSWNFGVDFSFFSNRLMGSIDLYNRNTTDLLGPRAADPTLGWRSVNVNYGAMRNRGIEISLNSLNINLENLQWSTDFTFSYNSNVVTEIDNSSLTPFYMVQAPIEFEGKPAGALYAYRWAGLNEQGEPMIYDKDGNKHTAPTGDPEDLVYTGTAIAPFATSLNNTLSFYGVNLSFLLVYYGGHVMRVDNGAYFWGYYYSPGNNAYDRRTLNLWQKAGDEAELTTPPAINLWQMDTEVGQMWYGADIQVQPADYIKLRSVSLSYDLPNRWVERMHMSSFNVGVQVNNPLKWVANQNGSDPESMTMQGYWWAKRATPIVPTYLVRLSMSF